MLCAIALRQTKCRRCNRQAARERHMTVGVIDIVSDEARLSYHRKPSLVRPDDDERALRSRQPKVPMALRWTTAAMPRLDDRIAIVTGANSGLGLEAATALAAAGATVL